MQRVIPLHVQAADRNTNKSCSWWNIHMCRWEVTKGNPITVQRCDASLQGPVTQATSITKQHTLGGAGWPNSKSPYWRSNGDWMARVHFQGCEKNPPPHVNTAPWSQTDCVSVCVCMLIPYMCFICVLVHNHRHCLACHPFPKEITHFILNTQTLLDTRYNLRHSTTAIQCVHNVS